MLAISYITAHFLFASAKYLFTQNCKAPSGVEIFDGFCQSELKQDADLARRDLAKDAKIARRRAYAFDSLRLYRRGGYVLLVGVAHNRNTYLHAVDEILGVPNRMSEEARLTVVRRTNGDLLERYLRVHETDYTDDISLRFPKYETPFRYYGAIRDGFVGNAPTQLCDARIMKEVMELIFQNSEGKDPLEGEEPIPPRLYC